MGFTKINTSKYLYLQSKKAENVSYNGSRPSIWTFSINPIDLKDYGRVSVASIASKNATANAIYTFRIPNIVCKDVFDTNFGSPIVFSNVLNPYCNSIKEVNITIPSQTFNTISILVSDDSGDFNAGVVAGFEFVLCLNIDEYDPPKVNYQDGTLNERQKLISSYH
jgi:hypothetical protein